jgi:hypothetical protein
MTRQMLKGFGVEPIFPGRPTKTEVAPDAGALEW